MEKLKSILKLMDSLFGDMTSKKIIICSQNRVYGHPERVEQLASVSESGYINAETYHLVLWNGSGTSVHGWGFDAENSGLFDDYSIHKASPEPLESPFVVISSENNFDVNLVYLDGYGNKQVYEPIGNDEVLDSIFSKNI